MIFLCFIAAVLDFFLPFWKHPIRPFCAKWFFPVLAPKGTHYFHTYLWLGLDPLIEGTLGVRFWFWKVGSFSFRKLLPQMQKNSIQRGNISDFFFLQFLWNIIALKIDFINQNCTCCTFKANKTTYREKVVFKKRIVRPSIFS